jgi:hypothetical protein
MKMTTYICNKNSIHTNKQDTSNLRYIQPYRNIKIFNWNTIYKYFIIENVYKYLKELQKPSKFLLSDTCLISNKLFKIMNNSIIINNQLVEFKFIENKIF